MKNERKNKIRTQAAAVANSSGYNTKRTIYVLNWILNCKDTLVGIGIEALCCRWVDIAID